jgi:hypothetical protein
MSTIIKVQPQLMPDCFPNCCFPNVADAVKQYGGQMVTGWIVSDQKAIRTLIHHAVWRRADGNMRCITPQVSQSDSDFVLCALHEIDFVPDASAIYDGVSARHNQYLPLIADERIATACGYLAISDRAAYAGDWQRSHFYTDKANGILKKHKMCMAKHDRTVVEHSTMYAGAVDRQRKVIDGCQEQAET